MNEAEMVRRLHKGEASALEAMIDAYTRYVSSILTRLLKGRNEDCEELTADVFLAAWENRKNLQKGKVKGYLGTIARNKAFDLLRKNNEVLPLEEDIVLIDNDSVQEQAERNDTARLLDAALRQLGPKQRELFIRHYYYGQTVREAADEMGLNISTAKTWLKRGREALKEILRKEGYYYEFERAENL